MSQDMFNYPALYNTANDLSAKSQTNYLRLIKAEYFLLIVAAVLSLNFFNSVGYFIIHALVFFSALSIMLVRNVLKPEQDWYRGRALAESIKTSCWRYCMRSEPFGDVDRVQIRRGEFRNHLLRILEANRHIGDRMPPDSAAQDQVTPSMERTRALNVDERKRHYEKHRIREQRTWYAKKAIENRQTSLKWVIVATVSYSVAIILVLTRIGHPQIRILPIEPLIVVAASVVGWMQVKKYNELASSYTLTAHEIGIIQGKLIEIHTEEELSEFVNDAEQAFSREHTQWVARQQLN